VQLYATPNYATRTAKLTRSSMQGKMTHPPGTMSAAGHPATKAATIPLHILHTALTVGDDLPASAAGNMTPIPGVINMAGRPATKASSTR
jgi:hypothetical protein